MTKGSPIFEWIPGIPITDKDNKRQSGEDEISTTHEDEHDYDISENGKYEDNIEEDTYEDEHLSDRENDPSNDINKN